jgi:hypothetical protein
MEHSTLDRKPDTQSAGQLCTFPSRGLHRSLPIPLHALRGGAGDTPSKAVSGGTALGEKQMERLFGTQYSLDLKVAHNRATLVRLVKDHRLGGGEFNAVTLDGKEYHIPGTKKGSDTGPSSHFSDLGQGAGRTAKGEIKSKDDKVNAAKRALAAATEYKGVTYTEASFLRFSKVLSSDFSSQCT